LKKPFAALSKGEQFHRRQGTDHRICHHTTERCLKLTLYQNGHRHVAAQIKQRMDNLPSPSLFAARRGAATPLHIRLPRRPSDGPD
jgi:hypothetical protein